MSKSSRTLQGSLTVEGAFVVPIVLFIIFALMNMSFYMYDFCIIKSVANEVVSDVCYVCQEKSCISRIVQEENSDLYTLSKEQKQKLYAVIEKSVNSKLIFFKFDATSLDLSFQNITFSITVSRKVAYRYLRQLLPKLSVTVHSYGQIHNPVQSVRWGKLLYEEFNKTIVHDKLQELLK